MNPLLRLGTLAGRPDVRCQVGFPVKVPLPCPGFPPAALADDWPDEVRPGLGGTVLEAVELPAF